MTEGNRKMDRMSREWVTSLGELVSVFLLVVPCLQVGAAPPFCPGDCSCTLADSCLVCPKGFGELRWRKPSNLAEYYGDLNCLKLSKGFEEELTGLLYTGRLRDVEIHRYILTAISRKSLPIYNNHNLTSLKLSGNAIVEISGDFFDGLVALKELDLSNNQIQQIQPELFEYIPNLEFLNLEENWITNLPPVTFSKQVNLQSLSLRDNRIGYLHHELFVNTTSLKNVDFSHNNIKAVPEEIVKEFFDWRVLKLNANPWDCSCSVTELARFLQERTTPSLQVEEPLCRSPQEYSGKPLSKLDLSQVSCSPPIVTAVSDSEDFLYGAKFTLTCEADGHPDPAVLWVTPAGDFFGHPSGYHLLGQSHLVKVISDKTYVFADHLQRTRVVSQRSGEIIVDGMRGTLAGNYTCIAVNPAGEDSANVTLYVHTGLPVAFSGSLVFTAKLTAAFVVLSVIIGLIACTVRRCDKLRKRKEKAKQASVAASESGTVDFQSEDLGDFDENLDPDMPRDGSPMLSVQASEASGEEYDKFAPEFPDNIIETLDDVRWRLRHGVERKMERVRSHVQTIKSSGSQYIDTLRSSSSHAANRLRTGMVMGMEQVKYGVQSIKEFCGTGDMGTQTISTISVSTDVDTQQSVETVKTIYMTDV